MARCGDLPHVKLEQSSAVLFSCLVSVRLSRAHDGQTQHAPNSRGDPRHCGSKAHLLLTSLLCVGSLSVVYLTLETQVASCSTPCHAEISPAEMAKYTEP